MKLRYIISCIMLVFVMNACANNPRGVDLGTSGAKAKNVLLICIDDLRPELNSFGASYIKSPNIDRLATEGRAFRHHYVNAPSCGPSRYTLLTGRYGPYGNQALFVRAKELAQKPNNIPPSMPEWFRQHGYTTVSVGKVSHHPGGRGGKDWDDDSQPEMPDAWDRHLLPVGPWQHPRGLMHGLANGEIRVRGKTDILQALPGPDTIYPDGIITEEALKQFDILTEAEKPFFLAIGIMKPHLPFGCPKKYLDLYDGVRLPSIPHPQKPAGKTTWHGSGEFMGQYNRWGKDPREDEQFAEQVRRYYAACVSFADAQVGRILNKLKKTGADKNTVVILWGDHGWHLGEHAIWGKHALFEESLHSPLIIHYPGMDKSGEKTDAVVESLDIFPTLCDLTGVSKPGFIHGVSLQPMLENPMAPGHSAVGYAGKADTIRTATHRLIVHKDGWTELYDHTSSEQETLNIADKHPEIVEQLKKALNGRLALKSGH